MAGYTRQESGNIVDGNIIQASHLNNEYDQLESAFNATTGHAHDGSTGNAPQIDLTTSVTGALPVANGGTNATTASAARTSLGLVIGTDVQAYDAGLASIAGLTTAADKMIYTTASDTYATASLTSFARTLLDDSSASVARATLGVVIGTDVQAYNSNLTTYVSNALSAAELQQLQNINSSTISATQWGYVGALDQALTSSSSVTFSGLSGATLENIDYTVATITTAMNFSNGNSGKVTATGNITFTFSNVPSGLAIYTLFLTNGGAYTITWPGSVNWGDAGTPTLQSSGTDILTFVSNDGGTTFYGTQSWTG